MKKASTLLFAPLIGIMVSGCATNSLPEETVSFNEKSYTLTFYDDFEGSYLDAGNWERCPEWKRQDKEGYWSNSCSYLKDGNLVLEAKKSGEKLLSGAIRSKGKFQQSEGLYKIRFKAEKASGLWHAFWLMSDKEKNVGNGAVDGAEIDIMEIVPNDQSQPEEKRTYINSAVHWDGYQEDHKSKGSQYFIDDSFYNEWHEVTFEWTPEYYKAYLDGNEEPFWDTEGQAEDYGGIVKSENYIKITAEFGTWGGETDESVLPVHMYVDWVKAYKAD